MPAAARSLERVAAELPLEPLPPSDPGEVATRWRYRDGGGEIGVIASVTQPFCGTCTRARLTAEGLLFTCLFGVRGRDLRGPLRAATTTRPCGPAWRQPGHGAPTATRSSVPRATDALPKVEMSRIGG